MKKFLKIILFTASAVLFSTEAFAETPEIVQMYLEDPERSLEFEDIIKFSSDRFLKIEKEDALSAGFSRSVYWIRAELKNLSPEKKYILEVEFFPLDKIYFYDASTDRKVKILGDSVSGKDREIKSRNHAFRYQPSGDSGTVYFKIDTRSTIYFPLNLFEENNYRDHQYVEQYLMGICFGIILIMIVYNFLVYINLRYKLYLNYVIFTVCISIYLLIDHGYAKMFFWDHAPYLSNIMNPLWAILTAITGLLLTYRFLILKKYRILRKLIRAVNVFFIMCIPSLFMLDYRYLLPVINFLVLSAVILIFTGLYLEIRRKKVMAYFYALGFSGFLLIALLSSLSNLGVFQQNFISTYGFMLSAVFDVTVLSFALAYRINILRKQKDFYRSESIFARQSYNLLKDEVEIARKIQNSILPALIPEISRLKIETVYLPHGSVGGDLYDFVQISGHELGILAADVSGHGVPASLLASRVSFAFSLQENCYRQPELLMKGLNQSLFSKMGGQFVTAVYIFIDTEKNILNYVSAGHHPIIIMNKDSGNIFCKKPAGRLIGVFSDIAVTESHFEIQKGDRILIYTDGLLESFGHVESYFASGGIVEILKSTVKMNPEEAKQLFLNELSLLDQIRDDVTFILIDVD
ncbi:MAG: SpoIIE family protein phosphatase [Spirochaetia bacterium]|nr:SpoIIE family protein phosphatase [Spirochaetia bacterium]